MAVDHLPLFPDSLQAIIAQAPGLVVEKLKGDVSTRQYFRLILSDVADAKQFIKRCAEAAGPDAELEDCREVRESSIVAMILPRGGAARASRVIVDVSGYIDRCGAPIPEIHLALHDLGFLIIEDLGDVRLFDVADEIDDSELEEAYQKLVDYVVLMQFPAVSVPRNCIAYSYAFSAEYFLNELKLFVEPFSELVLKRGMTLSERAVIERAFPAVCKELMRQEMVFTHRDYHSRNVMVKDGKPRVIDYQDARLGPILYDIVSLIYDPYVSLSQDTQQELIDYYLARLPAKSRNIIRSLGIRRAFDLCLTQRCLKAAGTFAFVAARRQDSDYLRFMPRAIESAIDATRRNGDLLELSNMLTHWLERTHEFLS